MLCPPRSKLHCKKQKTIVWIQNTKPTVARPGSSLQRCLLKDPTSTGSSIHHGVISRAYTVQNHFKTRFVITIKKHFFFSQFSCTPRQFCDSFRCDLQAREARTTNYPPQVTSSQTTPSEQLPTSKQQSTVKTDTLRASLKTSCCRKTSSTRSHPEQRRAMDDMMEVLRRQMHVREPAAKRYLRRTGTTTNGSWMI